MAWQRRLAVGSRGLLGRLRLDESFQRDGKMRLPHPPLITLLTDFGVHDAYVGAMRGVLLSRCPTVSLVDITHEVPPHDIRRAGFLLAAAAPWFPDGTVHLAVVDPGVGGSRRAIVLESDRQLFVGPDNGLFTRVAGHASSWRAFELEPTRLGLSEIHPTFHGRDLFAPAAAALAGGRGAEEFGARVSDIVRVSLPEPSRVSVDETELAVVHVDRFGNVVTSLGLDSRERAPGAPPWTIVCRGRPVPLPLVATYSEASPGALFAVWGSSGMLEISLAQARADTLLGVGLGDRLVIRRAAPGRDRA
jgi:S-adenosylmethionine hydrolase